MKKLFLKLLKRCPHLLVDLIALQEKVQYTEIARRAGVEGTVYIEARIDKNGDVVDAIV